MTRRSIIVAVVLTAASGGAAAADRTSDAHRWTIGLELGLASAATDLPSWVDGGVGRLRRSADDRMLTASRWYGEYAGRLGDAWSVHATVDAVDDASSGLGLTEAYVEWRARPVRPGRQRLKVGFFQGPWSLENFGPAWSTPLTLSASAVNTWLGEEIRPLGAEWSRTQRIGARAIQQFSVHAAGFVGNDPAGSLLAWRGWSLHDRQSRLGDELPLAPLPLLQPAAMFAQQAPYVAPWREIDGRAGFYAGAEWRYARRAELRLAHYDNRGDPTQLEDGQYAWHTRFQQLGLELALPAQVGLLAQSMRGDTAMGPLLGPAHAVDADYRAAYLLATRPFGAHRVTLRRDAFDITDRDRVPGDDNADSGRAWTLAYRYEHSARWSLGAEWLRIRSWHPAWAYSGLPTRATETQLQLRFDLRFSAIGAQ